ncbi:hypothetical protein [Micromonospora maritima]|uniref:hypothetical protein n=1 Tax=Micromonospora maritima TaxID=986711 RepID=UPI00157CAA8A|nr:hypothetical protein [Micromonospora maritima]
MAMPRRARRAVLALWVFWALAAVIGVGAVAHRGWNPLTVAAVALSAAHAVYLVAATTYTLRRYRA